MFDHKHYVPIIKSKAGEMWTLRHMNAPAKSMTTPLMEMLEHKTLSVEDHVGNTCESLVSAWGVSDPIFIDTLYLGTEGSSGASNFAHVFTAARANGIKAIPVTSIARSPAYQQAVQQAIGLDGHGVAIRLASRDFIDPQALNAALAGLARLFNLKRGSIDLILDYGARTESPELVQLSRLHLALVPQIQQWRTLTLAAGSFPGSLLSMAVNTWNQQSREEWIAWITTLTKGKLPDRLPSHGDYAVRDPGAPSTFGTPSANLRYTCTDYWLVRRGRLVKQGGSTDMVNICRSLVARPEFSGATFSAGDGEIHRIATTQGSTGNAQQWIQWCMSHHFEYVADQIRNHPGL